ncbi:BTAD domain-containing putative transcriptional regulator [Actinoallomurus bryophytorum]|uniref:DNA-binding SARP family transcriptional activator n=1 Tax=Actinoallomurus bryophytorum TaxID=1490222 RepID=A0A543CTN0_9ACTN|nr:BTAD domain-containing putative transcriptional regulator [Actinoallomurus bryophytorum]TQM00457.1 DNA-binding SARP family transcriptional activator [Actinoallomurus bryophytorum]
MEVGRLRVELLGPVRLTGGRRELQAGSAKQRLVLAVLALQADRVVSREALIDAVWGEEPPDAAEDGLYTYVSRLRRVLDPSRTGEILVTEGSGYRLRADAVEVDVEEFVRLGELGRRRGEAGDPDGALDALESALGLWRGEPLSDVQGSFVTAQRARMTELRLLAVERRAGALIQRGRQAEVITDLTPLVAEYPLREELNALLMLALHENGGSAEALEVFERVEMTLADQLGLGPGDRLHGMRQRVLDKLLQRPLAGRSAEKALLRERLADLRAGQGSVIWVEGGPRVGKSALLAAGMAGAEESGCRVFRLAAEDGGPNSPADLMRCFRGIEADPAEPVYVTIDRLVRDVRAMCDRRPILLVVDDFHHVDEGGLLAWRRLVKVAADRPLCLVAAGRPDENRRELRRLAETISNVGHAIELKPLGEAGVAELVTDVTGTAPGPELLEVLGCAAGNPGRLIDIIEALASASLLRIEEGRLVLARAYYEDTLSEVVRPWLRVLTQPCLRLVRAAALLGFEFDLDDLTALLGQALPALARPLSEAVENGVLRQLGRRMAFQHPMLCRAVELTSPESERPIRHREAARALEEAGAMPDRVAAQLLLAELPPDAWTIRWLLTHAEVLAIQAPKLAVGLVERVLAWRGLRSASRVDLTALLVRLVWRQGGRPVEEAAFVELATTDAELAAEMRLVTAYLQSDGGEPAVAQDTIRRALADPALHVRWRIRLECLRGQIEYAEHGRDFATKAVRAAEEAGDVLGVAYARHRLWQLQWQLGDHDGALAHVEAGIEAVSGQRDAIEVELGLWGDKVFSLQQLDRLEEAERALATARALAIRRGVAGGIAPLAAVHWYWLGRWDDAIADLEYTMYDGWYCLRRSGVFRLVQGLRAVIAAHRDDSVGLEAALKTTWSSGEEATRTATFDFLLVGAAMAAEQDGRPLDALAILEPLLSGPATGGVAAHQWLPRMARLAVEVGDLPLARRIVAACEAEAAKEWSPARAGVTLRWCAGLAESDPEPVLAAAERFAALGRRIEQAMALEDAAGIFARSSMIQAAALHGHQAMELYAELGALWDLRRTETLLAGHGIVRAGGRRAPSHLSPTEYKVAELVAAGWANGEIGMALSLPRAAVQEHILNVVAKTGARSRLSVTPQLVESLRGSAGTGRPRG